TREFFGLATLQIRRELLDLARHFYGPHGQGANHASQGSPAISRQPTCDPPDEGDDPDDFERWCAFHREVERLPAEEREIVGLIVYHGWTQVQVAELLHIGERTVRRRWEAALEKLHQALNEGTGTGT